MGKKFFTCANVLIIIYLVTSHYKLPYKWEFLALSVVILGVLLALWNRPPKHGDTESDGRSQRR